MDDQPAEGRMINTPPLMQWAKRNGISQSVLSDLMNTLASVVPQPSYAATGSESAAQQRIRLEAPKHGDRLFRNNVGATPAKTQHRCPHCNNHFTVRNQPIRYGLANDSTSVNKKIKSSDLIGITTITVTPQHVGATLGIFTAIECKKPGWAYTGTPREQGQLAFMQVVIGLGGFAQFATDPSNIWCKS